MRPLPRAVWHYVFLLIFLFTIASLAAWTTIDYLYHNITDEAYKEVLDVASFKVWALTMGFMFISGAFGLWAIQFSAEAESRFRVGQIVEQMDYLNDGLIVVDKKGKVTGANPASRRMAEVDAVRQVSLREMFPMLSEGDVSLLLDLGGPNELQKEMFDVGGKRTLRFRSQTEGGIVLVLISDVTKMTLREMREQQMARLELIGRIARGVAHDFTTILSGISGHSALLSRLKPGSPEMGRSVEEIASEAGKGAVLARHLLEFSRLKSAGKSTAALADHVRRASNLARVGLSPAWTIEVVADEDCPPIAFTGVEVEQMVLNTALVATDALSSPGVLRIVSGRPRKDFLMDVGDEYAAVILVSASTGTGRDVTMDYSNETDSEDAGVIQSVVRSLLEQAGGSLDVFFGSDRSHIYRMVLPYGTVELEDSSGEALPDELRSYVSHWQVLLARDTREHDYVEEELRGMNVSVERVDNVMSALARIEKGHGLQSIVIDKNLLGDESDGLLRAIMKLCPKTGLVVLCEDPEIEPQDIMTDVVFLSRRANPAKIIKGMVEARGLAVQHQGRQ
jgi:signal transduction histidine kinase